MEKNSPKLEKYNSEETDFIIDSLESHFNVSPEFITDNSIKLNGEIYSLNSLSSLIFEHNKGITMSKYNELSLEKQSLINWRNYNIPSLKDVTVTPMVGTALTNSDRNNPLSLYNEWLVASCYLLKEYNIWIKVKLFLDNDSINNSHISSTVNKKAYHYYILRQFLMYNVVPPFNPMDYIIDFTSYDNIYRELSEDLLYILLNLLLANKIIGDKNLELSLDNKDKFMVILCSIIENHYIQYNDAYISLESLKWYSYTNSVSYKQIEISYANYLKINY